MKNFGLNKFNNSQKNLIKISFLIFLLILVNSCKTNNEEEQLSYKVSEHKIFGHLGSNHIANMVARKGTEGYRFTAWGRIPITEWPVESSNKNQVVQSTSELRYSNGGCAMDIDGDGIDEIIVARGDIRNLSNAKMYWFDEVEGQEYWEEYMIDDIWEGGYVAPHDIKPYVQEDNGFKGILANKGRDELYLYPVPNDPKGNWERIHIASFSNQSGMEVIDINGDGYEDIVTGMYWIEGPENPRQQASWEMHRFGEWDKNDWSWGGMIQHGIADFDGDGKLELVTSEAEIPHARLAMFDRNDNNPTDLWEETLLDSTLYAPHSVVVADLNNDQQPDFIVGEMTAGGWDFPMIAHLKVYTYVNQGDMEFKRTILCEGSGVHEKRVFPDPYEGKLMIYAADKIQPQKFTNMNTHCSYWLIEPR